MATLKVIAPAVIKIENKNTVDTKKSINFVPYRENFVTPVPAGVSVEFSVETSGQILYYLEQATNGLEVSQIADFDAPSATNLPIKLPAKITITNTSDKKRVFVPYKENFVQEIAAGDSIELKAKTAGQVLYYLSQEDEGLGLVVDQEHIDADGENNE